MTTRERVMAALAGREVNGVPLAVWMHNFASENSAGGLAAENANQQWTRIRKWDLFARDRNPS